MIYYFAYGSNLSEEQMKQRCPNHKLLYVAVLKNYRLDFTIYSNKRDCGCADIIKDNGKEVWGLVYSLSESDLKSLDKSEGAPINYKRIKVHIINKMNKAKEVHTYEVTEKQPFQAPSNEYLNIIKNAARRYNFPKTYKDFLETINSK